jgi:hypothetical protein
MKKKKKGEEERREEGVYMLVEKSASPKVDRSEAKREMRRGYHWFVTERRVTHPLRHMGTSQLYLMARALHVILLLYRTAQGTWLEIVPADP